MIDVDQLQRPSQVVHRSFLIALAALLTVASSLVGAHSVSADEVQYQSYQRASQSEECVSQPGETPWQASWGTDSSWRPSWELWANNGTGGWVCSRSITWARDEATSPLIPSPSIPGAGCVPFDIYYLDFGGSYFLPKTSTVYSDGTCTTPYSPLGPDVVYTATGGESRARELCILAFGSDKNYYSRFTPVYLCITYAP
jgi:hypothetical protein